MFTPCTSALRTAAASPAIRREFSTQSMQRISTEVEIFRGVSIVAVGLTGLGGGLYQSYNKTLDVLQDTKSAESQIARVTCVVFHSAGGFTEGFLGGCCMACLGVVGIVLSPIMLPAYVVYKMNSEKNQS